MGQPDLVVGRPAFESGEWEDRPGIQQDKAVVRQGCVLVACVLKYDRMDLVGTVEGKEKGKGGKIEKEILILYSSVYKS